MRLYPDEKQVLDRLLQDLNAEVYLFGSRVDDNAKGGDIDILVYAKQEPWTLARKLSREFFIALDSKLDVVVLDKDNMSEEQRIFVQSLRMERLK
jgi:Nucleotidyltransferase domain.